MKRNRFAIGILAVFLVVGGLYSQDQSSKLYDEGRALLDGSHWAEAIEKFDQAAKQGGSRADAALYMKAFAQEKQGLRTETLATIQELQRSFPESRYINDAKALELRVRQEAGLPVEPDQQADEDLKLLAINSLMHTDAEKAVPLLEKIQRNTPTDRLTKTA
jgi:outer membrane protein assembly factor BamD (BamD/ComL family)